MVTLLTAVFVYWAVGLRVHMAKVDDAVGAQIEGQVSAGVGEGWVTAVSSHLQQAEYYVSWQNGQYQAPNRTQNLRAFFLPAGIRVQPRQASDWRWGLELVRYSQGDQVVEAKSVSLTAVGPRFTYDRGQLSEWYVNESRGLEQGFTLPQPLADGDNWHLDLAISGDLQPRWMEPGQSLAFYTAGRKVLQYKGLAAYDATGRTLPADMELIELEDGRTAIRLNIVASTATYPITVDPFILTPEADWTSFTVQDANYGFSVDTAGDINGDGFDDVIVGANWFDLGQPDQGAAFVYAGGPGGLVPAFGWRVQGSRANEELGIAVSAAGDVNNDGYGDVLVGANSPLPDVGGKAYVFLGSSAGLLTTPVWTYTGEQLDDAFGTAVAGAGDVNGDDYDDVIVGAPRFIDGDMTGRAYVFYGEASGLSAQPDWIVQGDFASGSFGISVDTAGDVNNDGYDDVIIGDSEYAPDGVTGLAAVYLGDADGLPVSVPPLATLSDAASVQYGEVAPLPLSYQFGYSVGTAGDVNADGYDDVIVGAPGYGFQSMLFGAAYIYYGSLTGEVLSPTFLSEYVPDSMFGYDVGTAGDVDRDGYDDVIIGAPGYDASATPAQKGPTAVGGGAAFVYPGADFGADIYPIWSGASLNTDARYGTAAAFAGDVNADGYADVIVGAPQQPHPIGFSGQAFAYYGSGAIEALTAVNSSPTRLGLPTLFQAVNGDAGFLHYDWAFGDGATAAGKSQSHIYGAPGLYTAVVTATSLTDVLSATTPVTITVDSTITPIAGGELTFTNPETGFGLNVNVPPGAVTDLLKLSYTPLMTITQPWPDNSIGYYFDLDPVAPDQVFLPLVVGGSGGGGTAVLSSTALPQSLNNFPFLEPVSVRIFYNPDTLPASVNETDLKLLFWDKDSHTWIDAATSCSPASTYTYYPLLNWFSVDICHLSRFSVSG